MIESQAEKCAAKTSTSALDELEKAVAHSETRENNTAMEKLSFVKGWITQAIKNHPRMAEFDAPPLCDLEQVRRIIGALTKDGQ